MNVCAEVFVKFLEAKGLNCISYEGEDGDYIVDFPFQGKVVKLIFFGENYMSAYMVYEQAPEDRYADTVFLCNELNCQYKWITFFVDKDRDIILHDDAILTVETAADEVFELLIRMLKIGDDVKPAVMKVLYA